VFTPITPVSYQRPRRHRSDDAHSPNDLHQRREKNKKGTIFEPSSNGFVMDDTLRGDLHHRISPEFIAEYSFIE
jgi:hypothetical protein